VQVIKLVQTERLTGLGIEEGMVAVRVPLMLRSQQGDGLFIQRQQAFTPQSVPTLQMEIGPRQCEQFALPQADGESNVDDGQHTRTSRRVQIAANLPRPESRGRLAFQGWNFAEVRRIEVEEPILAGVVQTVPKEQMNAPDTAGTEPAFRQRFIKGTDVMWLQLGELPKPETMCR